MDTQIDNTQPFPNLPQRIHDCYVKARGTIGNFIPSTVVKDIDFFISASDVTPTCSTNTRIAFHMGKLAATATGGYALLVEIIWLCVLAKDMWIKGVFMPATVDCIEKAEKLLEAVEVWRKANLI